jgi:hypothetical protein
MRPLLIACLATVACAGTPVTAREDGTPLAVDAASARAILRGHCGACHRSDLPGNKPAAIRVFDLVRDDFYLTLRDDQFPTAIRRLNASAREEQLFKAWVDAELARRRAKP